MSHDAQASQVAHSNDHGHDTHHVNYLAIFIVLCVCTALSVIFDVVHMSKPITIVLVMAVAITKALCVMMFFMHLKFEGNWKFVGMRINAASVSPALQSGFNIDNILIKTPMQ